MFVSINPKKTKKMISFFIFASIILFAGKIFLDIYYPLKYFDVINEKALKYDLEPSFVCAIIRTESRFNKNVVSKKGASGLMQLMKNTAEWGMDELNIKNYTYKDIFKEELNIELGCWYIKKLITQYDGDEYLALASYNAGPGNVSKWLKNLSYSTDGKNLDYIPFKETRNYIEKVKFNEKVYSILIKFV